MSDIVPIVRIGRGVVWGDERQALVAHSRSPFLPGPRGEESRLLQRLREAVADDFPLRDGETVEAWAARSVADIPTSGRRAMLASKLAEAGRPLRDELTRTRGAWIAAERSAFARPDPQPCLLCGESSASCATHHVFPLALQFDAGRVDADHAIVWLCQAHHVDAHRHLNAMVYGAESPDGLSRPGDAYRLIEVLTSFIRASGWRPDPWPQVHR